MPVRYWNKSPKTQHRRYFVFFPIQYALFITSWGNEHTASGRYSVWARHYFGTKLGANAINIFLKALYLRVTKMHDSSMDRVALSENLTFYMTTLRAANENIKHRNDNVYRLQIIKKVTDWPNWHFITPKNVQLNIIGIHLYISMSTRNHRLWYE